jgi:hypothetical protein
MLPKVYTSLNETFLVWKKEKKSALWWATALKEFKFKIEVTCEMALRMNLGPSLIL